MSKNKKKKLKKKMNRESADAPVAEVGADGKSALEDVSRVVTLQVSVYLKWHQ
jgi:hypothetical protein